MDLQTEVKVGSHRFPMIWMAVTTVVVAACLGGTGYYLNKAYTTKHKAKTSTVVAQTVAKPTTPVVAKTQAAQASSDLKQIDLAQLQSSINDVKAALSGFSQ